MKIRKTILNDKEMNLFIYENKKDEYFVVAIPVIEWSTTYTYDDFGDMLLGKLINSLSLKLADEDAIALAHRINQWTREM
ncbi:YueH family protein [Heyndrickxia vini]|uniref:YueH family protein n=1 Tax=Heyndrickxia vini TaxID=1476025 RepID=A0ABX7DYV5_9BACI|nr:YueH family protein [Heyndrickxia vini]QQZ08156.1 YueH family protein [Heyndrickxia vini]